MQSNSFIFVYVPSFHERITEMMTVRFFSWFSVNVLYKSIQFYHVKHVFVATIFKSNIRPVFRDFCLQSGFICIIGCQNSAQASGVL